MERWLSWLKALDSKSSRRTKIRLEGSNPSLSAINLRLKVKLHIVKYAISAYFTGFERTEQAKASESAALQQSIHQLIF
jgi:hypothetical protein